MSTPTQRVNDKNRPLTKNRTRYTETEMGSRGTKVTTLTHAFDSLSDLITEATTDCPEIALELSLIHI